MAMQPSTLQAVGVRCKGGRGSAARRAFRSGGNHPNQIETLMALRPRQHPGDAMA
eukprot:CAMPEP_0175770154 /NCGR_PEP_ID=MMETSP0097-20121207/71347_1 /TAXON_ID=311494 /ORGANISM="Alexandrium monilatum, Strain CCMP3105" /LENGTH=54 /DNA_ID=CAMNT_0017080387 /DNA_START=28 /DNA_END=188 /DNA_ORIENTATION=-